MVALNRRFAGVVPAAVARACQVAAIQGDTALIYCADGAAASRVRAQARGVARALGSEDAPVLGVRVKVRADWVVPARPDKPGLPGAGLRAFQALGDSLPEGGLKQAVGLLLARRRRT